MLNGGGHGKGMARHGGYGEGHTSSDLLQPQNTTKDHEARRPLTSARTSSKNLADLWNVAYRFGSFVCSPCHRLPQLHVACIVMT